MKLNFLSTIIQFNTPLFIQYCNVNFRNIKFLLRDNRYIISSLKFFKYNVFFLAALLCDICAVDYLYYYSRFFIIYNLWSLKYNIR
jgi:NADH:ubiquinone oxidoreductase subunit C